MKNESMKGKKALITGGAKRIGEAIAHSLVREGIDIVLHCNKSYEAALELASILDESGVKVWVVQADLSDPEQVPELFDKARSLAGGINFLINNASIFPRDTLTGFTAVDLAKNIQVNSFAPLELSRMFAAQNRKGKIINLLDARITDYDAEHVAYHLSKRMLFDLTKLMALEFAPAITVNGVAPGLILAPPGAPSPGTIPGGNEDFLENNSHTNPLHSHGDVDEIADTVLFLLKSEFITGQVIYVDGGRHLRGSVYGGV